MRNWLAKKLNPDAVVADPGGAMEAYYDKKLERWIFPGDDPAEVAKPLAPPPITPIVKSDPTPASTPNTNDPLAAMMAPPSRTISTPKNASNDPLAAMMAPPKRSISTPNSALRGPPLIPRSHTSGPPTPAKPATVPAAAPPQFVIFQPKPADTSKDEE